MKPLACLALMILAACAAAPMTDAGSTPDMAEDASITLQETPCFGFCPIYEMTLQSDGAYVLEAGQHTRDPGQHEGRLMPEAYQSAARALQAADFGAQPADITMNNPDACANPHTDAPTAAITWTRAGAEKTVTWYQGCNAPKMRQALTALRAAFNYDQLIAPDRE